MVCDPVCVFIVSAEEIASVEYSNGICGIEFRWYLAESTNKALLVIDLNTSV